MAYLYYGSCMYCQQPLRFPSLRALKRDKGKKNLHKGGNNPTAIAKAYLNRDSHATLDGPADVVSVPHDHDWDHRVHAACAKECANVLGGRYLGCNEQDVADYCSCRETK